MSTPNRYGTSRTILVVLAALLIVAVNGCQQPAPQAPADTRTEDEAAIRAAEAGMSKAVGALDAAKAVSFYTDDVVGMSPDGPLVQGKENMQKVFEGMMEGKPEISWTPSHVEVARSGDIAYSWGTGKEISKDSKGKVTESSLKYVSVWKKQADGSWKIAVDTFMSDPPEAKK